MIHQTAEQSREANVTYHLVPVPVWEESGGEPEYMPEAFEADGFIHCTNGLEPLRQMGNIFYKNDDRKHLVLVLDTTRITSEVRYDDPDEIYPHIYGPLNTDAVIGTLTVEREADGAFSRFSEHERQGN